MFPQSVIVRALEFLRSSAWRNGIVDFLAHGVSVKDLETHEINPSFSSLQRTL